LWDANDIKSNSSDASAVFAHVFSILTPTLKTLPGLYPDRPYKDDTIWFGVLGTTTNVAELSKVKLICFKRFSAGIVFYKSGRMCVM
jgi:hypothetical protein